MTIYPLELKIKLGSWRLFSARRQDPAFQATAKKVLARDAQTCQFCDFKASDYQEIINLDGNYRHNILSNMVVACRFCAQAFFIESIGMGNFGGGRLIYLPELSQSKLNALCHVLFCAMHTTNDYSDAAQLLYRELKARSRPIEEKLGEEGSAPAHFCQMLLEQEEKIEETSQRVFKNLRLLPLYPKFKTELDKWASAAVIQLEGNAEKSQR